jgi:histidinol-phosphate aminotransferase
MREYVPGEQPRIQNLIKLNTNENPYPPSEVVLESIRARVTGDVLRRYPDPSSAALREAIGARFGVPSDWVTCANGSDEALTILVRATVPEGGLIQYPDPTYSLYKTLAEIQGARVFEVPFDLDSHALPVDRFDEDAHLTLVAHPNAPTGRAWRREELCRLAEHLNGVLVIDQAYVDFSDDAADDLVHSYPNVVVLRTLSKSAGLAGLRLGWALANASLTLQFHKVRDSYNLDALAQAGGLAALEHWPLVTEACARVRATRQRVFEALIKRGWNVFPSSGNFLLAKPAVSDAVHWMAALRQKAILVRHFAGSRVEDRLRITIGTEAEMDRFLQVVDELSNGKSPIGGA